MRYEIECEMYCELYWNFIGLKKSVLVNPAAQSIKGAKTREQGSPSAPEEINKNGAQKRLCTAISVFQQLHIFDSS